MAELGSNGFDPSHLRIVPSSSGSGPNDKRDVTESPLLSFVTWEWEKRKTSGGEYRIYASRFPHVNPGRIIKGMLVHPLSLIHSLTCPRLKGRLFCVHLMSVSGTDPLTMHVRLYSISDMSCLGLTLIFTESGLTAGGHG